MMTVHAETSTPAGHARYWLPGDSQLRESAIRDAIAALNGSQTADLVESLIDRNRQIHEVECINLNPATNVMNPRAEARSPPAWARDPRSATPQRSTRWVSRRSRRSR